METTKRLLALDVLRGMTVCMMMIVNNPGSWSHIYSPLEHSPWNGCTPTDLVYPFFLFCVGLAVYFSFKKTDHQLNASSVRKIIKRMCLIFLVGLVLNICSWFMYNVSFINGFEFSSSFSHVRIMGVLQRIGIAYGLGALLVLSMDYKKGLLVALGILLAYWGIMLWGGDLSLENNFARKVDLFILGGSHLYHGYHSLAGDRIAFDPEGLFSTLPAIVSVMLGFNIGRLIDRSTSHKFAAKKLLIVGAGLIILGLLWNMIYPLNKPLWSSSYVVYATGLATLLLSFLIWILDVLGKKSLGTFFLPLGMNPLFIFILSDIYVITTMKIKWGGITLLGHIYNSLCTFLSPINASLAYALLFMLSMWCIAYILYKKKIYIKI